MKAKFGQCLNRIKKKKHEIVCHVRSTFVAGILKRIEYKFVQILEKAFVDLLLVCVLNLSEKFVAPHTLLQEKKK